MLTDAAGLVMALLAAHLMTKPATDKRTWGFQRAETLAACSASLVRAEARGLVLGGHVIGVPSRPGAGAVNAASA